MKIPGLTGLFESQARARLRHVMRGYRALKKTGNLGRIAAVKEALTITPVFCTDGNPEIFAGLNSRAAEKTVRQFLMVRLVGIGLGPALLSSVGRHNAPVIYPLPGAWRRILHEHGFEVAERRSAILWACAVVMYLASGIFVALKLGMADIRRLLRPTNITLNRHVYFDALGPGNLPAVDGAGEKNDIVSWYLRWSGRAQVLDSVCHNVLAAGTQVSDGTAIVPIPSPLLPFDNIGLLARFVFACAALTAKSFLNLMTGRWWHAMMLGETAKATHMRLQDPALLARDYLFHNSNWIYRPLWTYEAERRGCRVLFYFYSTNCEKFKHSGSYPSLAYGWQAMTWPQYIVWDDYQAAFVRRAAGSAVHIDVVGSIPFNSGIDVPQDLPEHAIAVFDVQPMRDAVYQSLAIDVEYYVPRNANKFLTDIQNATMEAARFMVFKRKRDVGTRVHPGYEHAINSLSITANYLEVDSDISASALIAKCQAVISTPFTSTALIARELGKPSVYYDPYGVCEKDDRAAHGITVIVGRSELVAWLMELNSEVGKVYIQR